MSEELSTKFIQFVGKHSMLYVWKDPRCTRMDRIYLVQENTVKELIELVIQFVFARTVIGLKM